MLGIYLVICTRNKKSYVGRAQDIDKRLERHFRELRLGYHHNVNMQRDYDKYGIHAFTVKRQRLSSIAECKLAEQIHIDSGKHKYNIGKSNVCGDNLTLHPDRVEIIARRAASCKASMDKLTNEERKLIYGKPGDENGMYGRTHTEEAKKIIGDRHRGNSYAKGIKRSDETKAKLSAIASKRTGETNPFFGKSHSEETKAKLRKANKGKLPTNTLKVKVGKKIYESASAAARDLGCAVASIGNRIKSPKFPEYSYVS